MGVDVAYAFQLPFFPTIFLFIFYVDFEITTCRVIPPPPPSYRKGLMSHVDWKNVTVSNIRVKRPITPLSSCHVPSWGSSADRSSSGRQLLSRDFPLATPSNQRGRLRWVIPERIKLRSSLSGYTKERQNRIC